MTLCVLQLDTPPFVSLAAMSVVLVRNDMPVGAAPTLVAVRCAPKPNTHDVPSVRVMVRVLYAIEAEEAPPAALPPIGLVSWPRRIS